MKIFQKQTKTLYLQFIVDESQEIVKVTFERENKIFNRKTLRYVISLDFFNTLDIENTSITKLHNIIKDSSSDDDTPCPLQSEPVHSGEGDIFIQQTHQPSLQANVDKVLLTSDKGAINYQNILFCDIETTGKGHNAEVCEIALIDFHGNILLNTLVKTTKKLTKRVTKIHFITNRMLSTAPPFEEVFLKFNNLIKDKVVVFYNSDFDKRIIKQSANIAFDSNVATFEKLIPPEHSKTFCLMNAYAKYWGKYDSRYQSYKWQSLIRACHQQKISIEDVQNHRALGDAIKTMRLFKVVFTS